MTKKISFQWSQVRGHTAGATSHLLPSDGADVWTPNTDVSEGPDNILIRMELPGVILDQVEIFLEHHHLMVCGNRRDPACEESAAGYRFRQLEIEYGPFRRSIELPYPVNGDQCRAVLRNGLLEVRLPRAQADRQKTIRVEVES
ncbi:MAG: Hsp20/alpha crystallin family protein [Spartobacteria bacterium]|nr:Hsp20/alpha crystallin family protein [Spartobacteria bacterium]